MTGDARWHPLDPAIAVFAADHGVTAHGVSAYPSEVTAQMVANFAAGGAAINVLARRVGARVVVVDVGTAQALQPPAVATPGVDLRLRPVRRGTADMTLGPAMRRDEAVAAIDVGIEIARSFAKAGSSLIGVGEMGIGNTTAASAIVAVMTGSAVAEVTGMGTGVDEAGRVRKIAAIERALATTKPDPSDPIGVLAAVGGLEIAGIVGLIVEAAVRRLPVVLDGFITGAAALISAGLDGRLRDRLIASHVSAEPGHAIALRQLQLEPLLSLGLRLGEGSGAALAFDLIDAACRIRDEMATFSSASISGPSQAVAERSR
jgi:nicotinate-nucleotide--dimethylbenzimidazole phosphoribosyltransferase